MIVVVLVHNQFELTKAFVESVIKSKDDKAGVKVLLINNGSTDPIIGQYLPQVCKDNKGLFVYKENKENLMFTVACAKAIEEWPGEDIYFLNNDVEVFDGWLDGRKDLGKDRYAMLGATQVYPLELNFITFAGGLPDFAGHKAMWKWQHERDFGGHIHEEPWLTFGACMVSRAVYDELGGLDLDLRHYCSDSDLSLRVVESGYKIGVVPSMIVAHWGSMTTKGLAQAMQSKPNPEVERIMQEGQQDQIAFAEKWGVNVQGQPNIFEPYVHSKRLDWFNKYFTQNPGMEARNKLLAVRTADKIQRILGDGKACLELGCAWGYNVQFLRDRGVEAYGVELSEVVKQLGKDYLYQMDLETDAFPDGLKDLDLVYSSAVLEHISEDKIYDLIRLKIFPILKPGGFMYHEIDTVAGIDRTHINIKPADYWVDLFVASGFKVVRKELTKNNMLKILLQKAG